MQQERKVRAVERVLGDPEIRKGDELVFLCPRCDHRKPKLSVNTRTDRFHCWICHWSGKDLLPILKMKGESEDVRLYRAYLGDEPKTDEPERTYDTPVLPNEFVSLTRDTRDPYVRSAFSYLSNRGVSMEDILKWKLGFCPRGEYKNRIIIPSFDADGELSFFVGRSIFPGNRTYLHGNFDKDIVFNELLIDWTQPVVITEGPFDAIKAGDNAIPLQGSFLRRESVLFRRIVTAGLPVYFAMDADAFETQMGIVEKFLKYGINCYYVSLRGRKDVGEMTHEEFLERKRTATPVESILDLLKVKVCA